MLVLERRTNESIHIGDEIEVLVTRIKGDKVWLGIVAPKEVPILRDDAVSTDPPDTQGATNG